MPFLLGLLVVFRELRHLLLQSGGLVVLLAGFGFHRRQFFFRHQGFDGTALQPLIERLDVGLGGGKFLLQSRGFLFFGLQLLLERLRLLLTLAQQGLLFAGRFSRFGQFAQQLVPAFSFFIQRQPQHGGQILRGVHLVGGDFHVHSGLRPLLPHLVDVHGGEGQQTHQQEVADDDQDAAVHGACLACR